MKRNDWIHLGALSILVVGSTRAADIGTAFTYQGSLEDGSGPVTADCNFQFTLWDDPDVGPPDIQIGPTLTFDGVGGNPLPVAVVGGFFKVALDFGAGAIDGTARWLELEVQCPEDVDFTLLSPRVELTPAPYAFRAVTGVGGPNALHVTATDQVGIGTPAPTESLEVAGNAKVVGTVFADAVSGNSPLEFMTGGITRIFIADPQPTSDCCTAHAYPSCDDGDCSTPICFGGMPECCSVEWTAECADAASTCEGCQLPPMQTRVGVNTIDPAATLDVDGDIHASGFITGALLTSKSSPSGGSITINGGGGPRIEFNNGNLEIRGDGSGLYMEEATGEVGIGTPNPRNKLDVEGGVAVGAGYSGTSAAPANGLIIQGHVGIGTATPSPIFDLHLQQEGPQTTMALDHYGLSGPQIVGRAARGTAASPIGLSGTDVMLRLQASGFDGNSFVTAAEILMGVYDTWTPTSHPSKMYFRTNSGVGLHQTRMVIDPFGNVGIGETFPSNKLEVAGGVTIGAAYTGTTVTPANGLIVEGNVGIGTAAPAQALEVVGNIHASGTIATGNTIAIDGASVPQTISTSDAVEFHLRGDRVWRLDPELTSGFSIAPNVLGGWHGNSVAPGVIGATIAGGGREYTQDGDSGGGIDPNIVSADFGTVGGGYGNAVSGSGATISGGLRNNSSGFYSTIGGGGSNDAGGDAATIGGGDSNNAGGDFSSIAGGYSNGASRRFASVMGGASNHAGGDYSLAAGHRAVIRSATATGEDPVACDGPGTCGDEGTFVWADSTNATFTSSGPDQFLVRSSGGLRLATGDGTPPRFQAVLGTNTASATDLALQPLGGNVGIGTNAPAASLHVSDSVPVLVLQDSNSTTTQTGYVSFRDSAGSEKGWVGFGSDANAHMHLMNLRSGGNTALGAGGTESLTITPGGNIGISTPSPTKKLVITDGNATLLFDGSGTTGGYTTSITMDSTGLGIGHNSSIRDIHFDTNSATRMLITGSGRVGIANSSPGHPLQVGTTSSNGNGAHVTVGGVWTNGSDRNSKQAFEDLDKQEILQQVAELPITRWQYKGEPQTVRHIGPVAQDFYAAFGTGDDERFIGTIDADGVALAAIQGLYEVVQEKDCEIEVLGSEIANLKSEIRDLKEVEARLARLEALLYDTITKEDKP